MAKLKYEIEWCGSGGPAPLGPMIRSKYIAGATGTPQTRIYKEGFSPSAFAAYPVTISPAEDTVYIVDYKDTGVALKQLGKFQLTAYAAACWVGGVYVNPFWTFDRFETYVRIAGLISAGSGTTQISLDLVTWKTLTSVGGAPELSATYTDTELAALGITDTIPVIFYKRTFKTDLLNVTNFAPDPGPGGPGPSFTKITVTGSTAGYSPGDIVFFQNSTLYGSMSGSVYSVASGYLILQMAYVGNQGGVQAYKNGTPCTGSMATDVFVGELSIAPFTASETHTDETAPDANNGTATVVVSGGSGSFTFAWSDGPTTQNRSALSAGTYTVTITDTVTAQDEILTIVITEPAIEPPPSGTYLDVPKMQSLRFVREAIIDNCNTFQTFDNTLFCKMKFPGVQIRAPFYQKVCKCDTFAIQILSNFPSHTIELLSRVSGALVKAFNNAELKQQLTGQTTSYDMRLQNSGGSDPAGTSRVYFNTGTIPVVVNLGDTFEIINNLDGYNGAYTIVGISNDELLGAPYLLITLAYAGPGPTSNGRAVFTTNLVDFDVYESILSFNDVAAGVYYVRIRGVNLDASFTEFVSEPIDLRVSHPNTQLLEARNFDNAADVVFTTGITLKIRLEGKLQKPVPGRQDENYRESNGSPVKLTSRPQRKYKLEYFNQPFYRLELLDVLFGWDQILINKVEYLSEEGTSEPANRDFYLLANGNVTVEQKQWFQQYNGDDLGSIDPGYILTQYGYIQRT